MTAPHPYRRYVAIGDSMTEGLGDPDPAGGHRGWADRLAEVLAGQEPSLAYANLAVRGRTTAQIRAEQLGPALELQPDLVTVMAGMNDLVRSGFDAASVVADIEEMFARLTESGARVATVTFPDLGKVSPLARRVLPASSTSTPACAPPRNGTASSSWTSSRTRSPPIRGCGPTTGSTRARWATRGSLPAWPTHSACRATATGPSRCRPGLPSPPCGPSASRCAGPWTFSGRGCGDGCADGRRATAARRRGRSQVR